MLTKIVIANRGEIALRIIRTARNQGYRTVAVYSDADAGAMHVQAAHEAVCIGGAAAVESYLSADKIIHAATLTGADAVHPGYGFLAENAAFARACEAAGLVFIGPGPEAIEMMGNKRLSKTAMQAAGIPCIPGYHGEDQSDDVLIAEARSLGLPLMVKAAAGGGGRGMRMVKEAGKLAESIRNARAEALSAFGSDELILETAIQEPRHVEIQVFADTHGNAVHLGERDCSIQRRHQKVIEEAPSPVVDERLRRKMGQAAVQAARACGYRGAGTVEFVVDKEQRFYFLEMNTRLQVEHPVTEMITGLDLVAWQIDIAAGEKLPLGQEDIVLQGHAMEARIYAEDPRRCFLPQTGQILSWEVPCADGLRVDAGIRKGQHISPYYDPMIAKVIAWGKNRNEARRRLAAALKDTVLLGVNNNKRFLERILRHPVFAAGEATTAFIERDLQPDAGMSGDAPPDRTIALAAMLFYQGAAASAGTDWHNPAPYGYSYQLCCDDTILSVVLTKNDTKFTAAIADRQVVLEWEGVDGATLVYIDNGVRRRASFAIMDDKLHLDDGNGHFIFENRTLAPAAAADGDSAGSGDVKSSLNGMVAEIPVRVGDAVRAGQTVLVIESMKMQHLLPATVSGKVAAVLAAVGDQIKPGQVLVELTKEGKEEEGLST